VSTHQRRRRGSVTTRSRSFTRDTCGGWHLCVTSAAVEAGRLDDRRPRIHCPAFRNGPRRCDHGCGVKSFSTLEATRAKQESQNLNPVDARRRTRLGFRSRSQYFNFDDLFSPFIIIALGSSIGSSRNRRATLAIELGGRSIYLNRLFRYRGASFHRYFATLALFIFTWRRLGATVAIERLSIY
jgi:hypothetical protein